MTTLQQLIDEYENQYKWQSDTQSWISLCIITAQQQAIKGLREALHAYEHGASSIARDALGENDPEAMEV